MRSLLLALMVLFIPTISCAATIVQDNSVPPCGSTGSGKPDCSSDAKSISIPQAIPTEDEGLIKPPKIPSDDIPMDSDKQNKDMADPKIRSNQTQP